MIPRILFSALVSASLASSGWSATLGLSTSTDPAHPIYSWTPPGQQYPKRYVITKVDGSVIFSTDPSAKPVTLSWTFTRGEPESPTGLGPHSIQYKQVASGKANPVKFSSNREDNEGNTCITNSKVTCTVIVPEIVFADPKASDWKDLEEKRVVLSDEKLRIKIKGGFESLDHFLALTPLKTIKLKTNGTKPDGVDFTVTNQNATFANGVVRVELTRQQLKDLGLIPNQDADSVAEKSWYDVSNATADSSLADSEAFAAGVAGELRGRCSPDGTLEDDPENSPLDHSFFKAAGVEIITAEFTSPEIKSKKRQVMNQADYFYYSGHGNSHDGSVAEGLKPGDAAPYWNQDLDVAILAGCGVLDINNYNGFLSHNNSPGKLWEPLGPALLLGYSFKAPKDNDGGTTIATNWAAERATHGDLEAWKNANDWEKGWNACAIVKDSSYFYFHRSGLPGFRTWTWTQVAKADW